MAGPGLEPVLGATLSAPSRPQPSALICNSFCKSHSPRPCPDLGGRGTGGHSQAFPRPPLPVGPSHSSGRGKGEGKGEQKQGKQNPGTVRNLPSVVFIFGGSVKLPFFIPRLDGECCPEQVRGAGGGGLHAGRNTGGSLELHGMAGRPHQLQPLGANFTWELGSRPPHARPLP